MTDKETRSNRKSQTNKKPFYKKPWFWLTILLVAGGGTAVYSMMHNPNSNYKFADGKSSSSTSEKKDESKKSKNSKNTKDDKSSENTKSSASKSSSNNEAAPADSNTKTDTEASKSKEETSTKNDEAKVNNTQSDAEAYQAIYNDYSAKIQDESAKLIEEYRAEAANNTEGVDGLARISKEKTKELSDLTSDGVEKMATVMAESGTEDTNEYQSYADKLTDLYKEEAGKIRDTYMELAQYEE